MVATSASETPRASAMCRCSSEVPISALWAMRARSRRRLKNSAFCEELVPPRTIDQLRSTWS